MKKSNSLCVIDYGSSLLRLGVFDEKFNCLHSSSKNIIEKNIPYSGANKSACLW